MKKEDIVMLKTVGQEFIIGEKVSEDETTIILNEARDFQLQMTQQGAAIILPPVFPFSSKQEQLKISKNQVLVISDSSLIDSEIINAYLSNVTGLDMSTGSKPKLVVPSI